RPPRGRRACRDRIQRRLLGAEAGNLQRCRGHRRLVARHLPAAGTQRPRAGRIQSVGSPAREHRRLHQDQRTSGRRAAPPALLMKRLRALAVAALTALSAMPAWTQSPPASARRVLEIDRIIAVVNEDVITRLDLNEHVKMAADALRRQGTPLPPSEVLEKQVLERMIAQKTQLQFAKEVGLRIDDATLDKTIARIAQENKLTIPQLRAALEKDGVSFQKFRDELRNEITI